MPDTLQFTSLALEPIEFSDNCKECLRIIPQKYIGGMDVK